MKHNAPNKLYDEIFPIKIYHADYYKLKYKMNFSMTEKFYLGIFKSCNDINKTELIMSDVISKTQILKIRKRFIKIGILKTFTVEEAKQFCIKNSHKGLKCEWCGKESYILHKHHYPISKKKCGTNVVNVCPNCHCTYHILITED